MHPSITTLLNGPKVIPVLVIEDPEDALPLARSLVDNGLSILEITLRSDAALNAIETIANQVEGAVVGVGSILTEAQLNAAQSAGGQFGVSPGVSFKLLQALEMSDWPFLPGAGSLSEMLTLRDAGFSQQKLFPAAVLGGISMLKAVAGPVGDISFCPTGGINPDNARDYLSQSNVFAIGGTWIAPLDLVRAKDWDEIGRRAAEAAMLGS
ncbi:bifunctional 4-hydroxy-2-oxoglutarate aldolase/2-dehydro-3-deoxy-phosphogluconate aldolase [Cohaesibacter celericrescens]|uniref:2-dehydro-3-deoxy-phosphogluconate aldolase n=1 Tax=Cohaesibacter celericrescens TaxID=2067669 RepID=A0A2N5XTE4_9HYPH|nr:bifunctional 4-hydroxy-2-oxoglutarate aldolase/2-dehydro-3-deoxy-phosphogluconate aldolase [Cohaesibacter celericrescens]PLW77782.1 keto-deoxy-phosphogluconate aldolase [Cohaesibacter celericrescens]